MKMGSALEDHVTVVGLVFQAMRDEQAVEQAYFKLKHLRLPVCSHPWLC